LGLMLICHYLSGFCFVNILCAELLYIITSWVHQCQSVFEDRLEIDLNK